MTPCGPEFPKRCIHSPNLWHIRSWLLSMRRNPSDKGEDLQMFARWRHRKCAMRMRFPITAWRPSRSRRWNLRLYIDQVSSGQIVLRSLESRDPDHMRHWMIHSNRSRWALLQLVTLEEHLDEHLDAEYLLYENTTAHVGHTQPYWLIIRIEPTYY